MLSLVALEDLFARLGTLEADRNLVRKARREAPVRRVQSHRSNVITKYSCMMVVRDIVRRHHRMPETLILDNGLEFHGDSLARVGLCCGPHIRFRPAGHPRVGSLVERAFGTVQTQLINRLAGNTQVRLHARMATKSELPDNFAEWTPVALVDSNEGKL